MPSSPRSNRCNALRKTNDQVLSNALAYRGTSYLFMKYKIKLFYTGILTKGNECHESRAWSFLPGFDRFVGKPRGEESQGNAQDDRLILHNAGCVMSISQELSVTCMYLLHSGVVAKNILRRFTKHRKKLLLCV